MSDTPARVLVVDDEEGVRVMLTRWLETAGYEVLQAENATTAIMQAQQSETMVALCDVRLPDPDGLWLAERLREDHPHTAIVFATANDAVPPNVSLREGVVGYVLKPFDRDRLLAAVAEGVAWHEMSRRRSKHTTQPDPVDEWLRGRPRRQ